MCLIGFDLNLTERMKKERFIMIDVLAFILLAVLGFAAMGCVYYLCEVDKSFEDDNRRRILVTTNKTVNNNGNDAA